CSVVHRQYNHPIKLTREHASLLGLSFTSFLLERCGTADKRSAYRQRYVRKMKTLTIRWQRHLNENN
ncbi:hypothetical protein, partial [Sulfurovum sp.]|uniref:hypothetical protein n=1 Tax=Sulfurovum sp. TaxID=1969726 RepID=UPI003569D1FB